jgi:hypothetical protein
MSDRVKLARAVAALEAQFHTLTADPFDGLKGW